MPNKKTYISLGDLIDFYQKIREKGIAFVVSNLKILPSKRIASKWNSYHPESDFWLIPEIQQHWNKLISGDKNTIYEEYIVSKFCANKSNLSLLSIGCGNGFHERNFAKHACFSKIEGIDFSEKTIQNAQNLANHDKLNIHYYSGDFKKIKVNQSQYDVLLFNSSLHHFDNIKNTLELYVKPLLKPDGILVIFEYCGPNKLQWTDSQLEKANQLLRQLPAKYKLIFDGYSVKKKVYRPGIVRMLLVDPSEAIDSEAIVSSLQSSFEVVEQVELGWNILHILLKGISHNFLNDSPKTKQLIDFLIKEEMLFLKNGNPSDAVFGVYRTK